MTPTILTGLYVSGIAGTTSACLVIKAACLALLVFAFQKALYPTLMHNMVPGDKYILYSQKSVLAYDKYHDL